MSDSAAKPNTLLPTDLFSSEELLQTLLNVSLTAVNILRPVFGPDKTEIIDFVLEYVNPAGQAMVGLSERPGVNLLSRFPYTQETGVFNFFEILILPLSPICYYLPNFFLQRSYFKLS